LPLTRASIATMPTTKANRSAGPEYGEMGDRLRLERRARGLSLRELANRLGVSPSLISQVETGRASPSVSTLYALASELDVSLDDLLFNGRTPSGRAAADAFEPEPEQEPETNPGSLSFPSSSAGPVQRAGNRKHIRLASGVTWERLTTASDPDLDFIYVVYEVGGASSPASAFQRHSGHEWGYVLSGTLSVTIGFDEYQLGPGDSVSFDSMVPHRLANLGEDPVHGIWFVMGRHANHQVPEVSALNGLEWQDPPALVREAGR
jgi:transcriptional regulator with XRE-family HTH domain